MISTCEKLALELGEIRLVVVNLRDDLEATKLDLRGLQELFEGCECFSTGEKMEVEP
jgi:hypothetical protein